MNDLIQIVERHLTEPRSSDAAADMVGNLRTDAAGR
jgi:hypothetical protein